MIWIMITLVASGLVIKQHGSRESCEDQAHVGRGLGYAAECYQLPDIEEDKHA